MSTTKVDLERMDSLGSMIVVPIYMGSQCVATLTVKCSDELDASDRIAVERVTEQIAGQLRRCAISDEIKQKVRQRTDRHLSVVSGLLKRVENLSRVTSRSPSQLEGGRGVSFSRADREGQSSNRPFTLRPAT